jgi:hypothetical protein
VLMYDGDGTQGDSESVGAEVRNVYAAHKKNEGRLEGRSVVSPAVAQLAGRRRIPGCAHGGDRIGTQKYTYVAFIILLTCLSACAASIPAFSANPWAQSQQLWQLQRIVLAIETKLSSSLTISDTTYNQYKSSA